MKKLTLTLCALAVMASGAFAGTQTYSGKEVQHVQTPCPQWYADNEWDIGVSGIYAQGVSDHGNGRNIDIFDRSFDVNANFNNVWGVAGDLKYFFHRYFGIGVQGFGLAVSNDGVTIDGVQVTDGRDTWVGGVLGTFTLRYPIPCSRWAPYAWWGIGGLFGSTNDRVVFDPRDEEFHDVSRSGSRLMGQYGLGFEVRFTNHIGWTLDGSYNQVEYSHNDFWMVRTGINFAF